jgi:hypothetical protein
MHYKHQIEKNSETVPIYIGLGVPVFVLCGVCFAIPVTYKGILMELQVYESDHRCPFFLRRK